MDQNGGVTDSTRAETHSKTLLRVTLSDKKPRKESTKPDRKIAAVCARYEIVYTECTPSSSLVVRPALEVTISKEFFRNDLVARDGLKFTRGLSQPEIGTSTVLVPVRPRSDHAALVAIPALVTSPTEDTHLTSTSLTRLSFST